MKTLLEILYRSASIKTLNICIDNLDSKNGKMLIEALYKNNISKYLRINDNQFRIKIDEERTNHVKFDFTENWPSVTYSNNDEARGTYLILLYLIGSLPTPSTSTDIVIPKCNKIEIVCESHDQDCHPILKIKAHTIIRGHGGQKINYQVVEKEPKTRYRVYTNRHADSNWQIHNYEFLSNHPLVQSLRPGDLVVLWIRSLHPVEFDEKLDTASDLTIFCLFLKL
ncbi:6345_t:CDS:2 [Dentiscutata erythropus]|uniref:6345_t:CDS:1 n=1 Tax=Dentiscutata erythropus TaxID=1348616 RepID=A0A9N9IQ28_9GLOM|nr:6345_t:CDS:2 [Dentiscutata erythropus]